MILNAHAKINLCLDVSDKTDALHRLKGVYATCSLADKVTVIKRSDREIRVGYKGKEGLYPNDSALRAARLMQETFDLGGVDVFVEKGIPEKAGLGGSSADAAAVCRAMEKIFDVEADKELLLRLGSDVPFQHEGGLCLVSGRGEKIVKGAWQPLLFCLLVPDGGVSTKECFDLFDRTGGENGDAEAFFSSLQKGALPRPFNALARAATTLNPDMEIGLGILKKAGFACGVTGSGSAVFGVEREEESFRKKLKSVCLPEKGFSLLTAVAVKE